MSPTLVVLTKVPGLLPVKTRLWSALGKPAAERLYHWMLAETVRRAVRLGRTVVAYSPPDADPALEFPRLSGCRFLPTGGADGSTCLENAVRGAFEGRRLLVLGGDAPDLPIALMRRALHALERRDASLVPSGDGGFTCLGLREPIEGLAQAFEFGAGTARTQLLRFLAQRERSCALLEPWPDVDTPEDLADLMRRRRSERVARQKAATPAGPNARLAGCPGGG